MNIFEIARTTELRKLRPLLGIVSLAFIQVGFAGGSCGGESDDGRQQLVVPDRPECSDLDEQQCLARPDCLPSYAATDCACPACEGDNCAPCDCGQPMFAACEIRREQVTCEEIQDEAACLARPGCSPIYMACDCAPCMEGTDCKACDCADAGFAGCSTGGWPVGCEGLDEASCLTRPECEPEYAAFRCAAPACPPGETCDTRCGSESAYAGCHLRDTGCGQCEPVACDLWCEFGFARDDRGCEVCACNPPPPPNDCWSLPEEKCVATPGCQAVYNGGSFADPAGVPCACPDCPPGATECPACDCARPAPPGFSYCAPVEDKCTTLDERSCNAEPSCVAEYLIPPCLPCDATSPEECPVCEPVFSGCHANGNTTCSGVMCDMWCEYGFQVGPDGCEICACNPPPVGCGTLDERSCLADPNCAPIYGETGCACPACDPATGEACRPCDCPPPERFYAGCADVGPSACAAVLCAPGTVCQECPPNADCRVQCVPVNNGACEALDEMSCLSRADCEAEYAEQACLAVPCIPDDAGNCMPPPCSTVVYNGCHVRLEQCPPIPAIWCPFGNVMDPMTGCATGTCNPNPECVGLSEADCTARMDCTAVYSETACLRICDPTVDPACGCGQTQFVECR